MNTEDFFQQENVVDLKQMQEEFEDISEET